MLRMHHFFFLRLFPRLEISIPHCKQARKERRGEEVAGGLEGKEEPTTDGEEPKSKEQGQALGAGGGGGGK